jgi:toluene monooxygenase system ferredoxin subunit
MPWIKAFPLARLQRERRCILRHAGTEILVLDVDGVIHALENLCPHQAFSLDNGLLDPEDGTLTCLHHQWCFRLSDGCGTNNQARVRTYATRIEGPYVWVECAD